MFKKAQAILVQIEHAKVHLTLNNTVQHPTP